MKIIFTPKHRGLLNHLRNPIDLWKCLNDLCEWHPDFDSKLEIHLAGNIDPSVVTSIRSLPFLENKLIQLGQLTHSEVILEYSKASILLLLLFNSKSGKGNYPGKLFEYIASNTKIILIGNRKSDAEKLMIDLGYKYFYDIYDNIEFDDILFDEPLKRVNTEVYSRVEQTKQLSKIFDKIVL